MKGSLFSVFRLVSRPALSFASSVRVTPSVPRPLALFHRLSLFCLGLTPGPSPVRCCCCCFFFSSSPWSHPVPSRVLGGAPSLESPAGDPVPGPAKSPPYLGTGQLSTNQN
ncbi:hypothetical protein B0T10DRAFT_264660 [Thelonectria olida]|uniref:Uncharacterized protein n=1 Tax=Thelonectria olida TaxID=1576542 RepID=A0A9P8WB32_9HYPO|nr:hypothetical protein B0T10DRAFT_264660 [Thelonectria olida]